jgi:flagellar basal body-associated protein FliL
VSEIQLEEPVPTTRRRRLVLIAVPVLLVALALAGWWIGFADAAEEVPDVDGEIVTLEPLTTTVGQNGIHHARVGIAIVLTVLADAEDVTPKTALLQDALLREVAAMDADAVRSAEGSDRLRERLTEEAREIWSDEVIRRVVLTELLVQ